jgi:hypothetical protein
MVYVVLSRLSEIVTWLAFPAVTVRVEELPVVMVAGFAVIVTVVAVAGGGSPLDELPLPHEVMIADARSALKMSAAERKTFSGDFRVILALRAFIFKASVYPSLLGCHRAIWR